jgi:hypothetical protein
LRTIHSDTAIAAPADVAWQVIADLPRYRERNPFITALDGDLRLPDLLPGDQPEKGTPAST